MLFEVFFSEKDKSLFNFFVNLFTPNILSFIFCLFKSSILFIKKFSKKLNKLLELSEKKTFKNKKLQINLALNYGSKFEIVNAFKNLCKNNDKINLKNMNKYLLTKNIPDPDMLIRTGNTKRLSNFLLWQLAYSELYFLKKLWPDFNSKDFKKIINKFKKSKRNFGNI